MEFKEQVKTVLREHKAMKEYIFSDISTAIQDVDEAKLAESIKGVFGDDCTVQSFKEQLIKGSLDGEKVLKLSEQVKCMEKKRKESDGVKGEHESRGPEQQKAAPAAPEKASDSDAGSHEQDYAKPLKEEADAKPDAKADGEKEEEYSVKALSERLGAMEAAMEGDLMELLKELVDKVNALSSKLDGNKAENAEGPLAANEEEEKDSSGEEARPEPKPPVTQEAAQPAMDEEYEEEKRENVSREIGRSFFRG